MKMMYGLMVAGLLLAASQASAADQITGVTLAEQCHAAVNRLEGKTLPPEGNIASSFCLGYLAGIEHLYTFLQSADPPPKFCLPEGTDIRHIVRTVMSYMRAHPEQQQFQRDYRRGAGLG
jgi:Rap1a immunity proteins